MPFAATVLKLALALLMSVQNNPAISDVQRNQAISIAMGAIQLANQVLGQGSPVADTPPLTPPTSEGGSTQASSIQVSSPNGGSYNTGSPVPINWTSSDYGQNGTKRVDINLFTYDPNSPVRNMVATIAPSVSGVGSYSWTIPSNITSGQYIIRISSSETGEQVWGFSQPFSVGRSSASINDLNVSVNDNVASGTLPLGSTDVVVGSYVISNPTSQNISISNFGVSWVFRITKLFVNGAQFGSPVSDGSGTDNFSAGTPLVLQPNSKTVVDLHADMTPTKFLGAGSLITTELKVCTGFGSTYPTYKCIQQTGQTMKVVQ